jgi:hypothetical protein
MAFEFPSTITARKEKKKAEKKKLEKKLEKIMAPMGKKKGMKGDLSQIQFEDAVRGKEDILIKKVKEGKDSLKKIVDAATDDNQLGSSERKIMRDVYLKGGGRAGYKSGSKGCKLAMKGKGRAYGKNS